MLNPTLVYPNKRKKGVKKGLLFLPRKGVRLHFLSANIAHK